jgi:ribonuclease Z
MRKRSKWFMRIAGGLVLVLLVGAMVLAVPSVEDGLFTRLVAHHLRKGADGLFSADALQVLLCGTSAPYADPDRAQSCVAVIAGGRYYLVDAGPGSGRNLELWQLRGRRLGAVFLTHFHSDHIGDLGEINTNAWLAGHPGRLQVFGGPGVEQVVDGLNEAYVLDHSYRTANSGSMLLPLAASAMQPIVINLIGQSTAAKDRRSLPIHFGELTVTAIEVNHDPAEPAYGYRFDYRGRSAVISGDTNYHPPLAAAAQGADVLVHEAQSQHLVQLIKNAATTTGKTRIAQIMGDIQHYHTDPMDAVRIAQQAHVRLLVFTHLDPPISNPLLYRMFYRAVERTRRGRWISGEDGTLVRLPLHCTDVVVSKLGR